MIYFCVEVLFFCFVLIVFSFFVPPFYLANLQFSVKTFQCTLIFYDFSNDNVFRINYLARNVYFALKRRFSMFTECLYLIVLFCWFRMMILYFIPTIV